MPRTFDLDDSSVVLIIGSGAGGGTLGNELAQKGVRTLILEAGPRIEREQHIDDARQSLPSCHGLIND
jgi:choline dehydrogenase-like flavoprotein